MLFSSFIFFLSILILSISVSILNSFQTNLFNLFVGNRFHLVDPSPWPFLVSIGAFSVFTASVNYIQNILESVVVFQLSFLYFGLCIARWFTDIVTEGTMEGQHTLAVLQGLRYGMLLFIVSEVMFFFSFFWAFFHFSTAPSVAIGCTWPPVGIQTLNPWLVPFVNTVILLTSGVTITWAHKALYARLRMETIIALVLTVTLGAIFTGFQGLEYKTSNFNINDSVYGSIFYMATGFHGFHVLVGTIFIVVGLIRHYYYHFTDTQHFGFESSAWYWHFVDVVWIFLFGTIYWWGS